jgi:hypothetical protein
LLVPPGVTTVTFLVDRGAVGDMVKVAVTVVEFTTDTLLTVIPLVNPDIFTAVAAVRLVPVRVTGTAAPRLPELGAIEDRVGAGGVVTVNVTALLVPPAATTVTFLVARGALAAIVKVAVTVVAFTTDTLLTVIPLVNPDIFTAVAPVRLVPVRVTGTAVPRMPELGAIEDKVGVGGFVTVKDTALLVPPGVTTVTSLDVRPAEDEIVKVAVIVEEFTTVTLATVIPLVNPEMFTAVAPVRLAPLRVTGTTAARKPELGVIELSVGAGMEEAMNSTAPTSTALLPFLGLSKKSFCGAKA